MAGVSPAINNHDMCSGEGPPWSSIGGWLLRTPFFIVAVLLVSYDDKKTICFNIIRNDVLVMFHFFGNSSETQLSNNKNRNITTIEITSTYMLLSPLVLSFRYCRRLGTS